MARRENPIKLPFVRIARIDIDRFSGYRSVLRARDLRATVEGRGQNLLISMVIDLRLDRKSSLARARLYTYICVHVYTLQTRDAAALSAVYIRWAGYFSSRL